MAKFLRHTGCDSCGSSDALATYSDNSTYCFSCGRSSGATRPGFIKEEQEETAVKPPDDLSYDYSEAMLLWACSKTGITVQELIQNDYYYSKKRAWAVRLLENEAFESRNLGGSNPRTKGQFFGSKGLVTGLVRGRLHPMESDAGRRNAPCFVSPSSRQLGFNRSGLAEACYAIGQLVYSESSQEEQASGCGLLLSSGHASEASCKEASCIQEESKRGNALIVVEDSLSAIKCARLYDSIPLFGSSINNEKLSRITKEYDTVYVWLDSDKLRASHAIADRLLMLGKEARVINTDLDPKYLNAQEHIK